MLLNRSNVKKQMNLGGWLKLPELLFCARQVAAGQVSAITVRRGAGFLKELDKLLRVARRVFALSVCRLRDVKDGLLTKSLERSLKFKEREIGFPCDRLKIGLQFQCRHALRVRQSRLARDQGIQSIGSISRKQRVHGIACHLVGIGEKLQRLGSLVGGLVKLAIAQVISAQREIGPAAWRRCLSRFAQKLQ